jgi:hypothetical protein
MSIVEYSQQNTFKKVDLLAFSRDRVRKATA